ncbi:YegS/Rv2252/BmrU family lipid kinase [Alloprevotella sp. OH1205_COT-284]|uniref:diacylglycerol/lipid kinase family protein n=1 Tax=Alloprevotella sp. OH1205_COT-284 TaxID=2491043 RepID=UPI000F5E68B0|nr:YegS/Rv2252/BmrU family lipid kinase [Alloprevotella sp. OH1205_COT-284]RRD80528.1 YegS/Rv2252/BmrU family lipid kinase [Alloprevotella sp. OH1205_COT-284]
MPHHIVFIINPISGTGRKDVVEEAIRRHIDGDRYACEIRYTERAGHAAEIAREAAEAGAHIVVAVGGDGTVNEVARSLVHTTTALGIVPCGSGNGLARHLRLPLDAEAAVKVINQGVVHRLDYGRINGQPFFCTCGVGFDAFISMKFAEAGKRGLVTYVEKTLKDGLRYKPQTYRITVDGNEGTAESYDAFLIACANASQYGNNAFIAPNASMKDGLLDVIILEPFGVLDTPAIVMQLFGKTLPQNSHVKTLRTRHLKIERQKAGVAHCDGDPFHTSETIEVELIPRSFNVVVNKTADLATRQTEEEVDFLQQILAPFQSWEPLSDLKRTSEELRRKTSRELRRLNATILEKLRKL